MYESDYILQRRAKMLGLSKAEPEKKKKKPIAHFSKKREKKQRVYRKIVGEMLAADSRCKVNSPVCTGYSPGLHHKVKRSEKNLTDLEILIPSCNACNSYLESHTAWGIKHGFIISKFKK